MRLLTEPPLRRGAVHELRCLSSGKHGLTVRSGGQPRRETLRAVTDLVVSNAAISFEDQPDGDALSPVINACDVRIPNEGFERIMKRVFVNPLDLTHLTVALVSCRLIDGGAEIIVRARRGFFDQNVTTHVTLSPAGNGDLRVTITYMRVGFLAASWLLEYVLGAVNRHPGLRQSGPKSIDVDIGAVLRSREAPVSSNAGVTGVSASAAEMIISMA